LFLDRSLVASQVALSLILLAGASLLLRTLGNIWALDVGYDRQNILMFSVDAGLAGKRGPDGLNTYRRLLDELRRIPAAQSVTASVVRPVTDTYYLVDSVRQVGDRSLSNDQRIRVAFNIVAPGYFDTMHIPVIAGRDFDERDSPPAPRVVIISERMARHFEGNPVGQRIGSGADAREVIGVARDMHYANVKDAPREVLYFPMFQAQGLGFTPSFEIRYGGSVSDAVQSIREAVARTDSGLTMFAVKTLEAQTRESLSRERLLAMVTTYVAVFAVLLACIGVYGLISYRTTRRSTEFGVRLALGAQTASVVRLVLRDAVTMVLTGAGAGLLGAFAGGKLVESQLFGVRPYDPIAPVGATLMLLLVAFFAAYLPARRAARTDPMTALRCE
jgi:predicted permease